MDERTMISADTSPHELHAALTAAAASGMITVLLLPAAAVAKLLGVEDAEQKLAPVELDYYLKEYQETYARRLSLSRIRELCVSGFFPDSTLPDGTVIAGAYKDSGGNWRITRTGIRARQELDRAHGLRQRATSQPKLPVTDRRPGRDGASDPADAVCDESLPHPPLTTNSLPASAPSKTVGPKQASASKAPRPRAKQGAWKQKRGVR